MIKIKLFSAKKGHFWRTPIPALAKRGLLMSGVLLGSAVARAVVGNPTVTNVSPNSGDPGASVVISGSLFNATPANNYVFFGGVRATVTAATSSALTVNVPTGATFDRISVTNTSFGTTGQAQYPFLPTFGSGAYTGSVNFATGVQVGTGSSPQAIAMGDMDGDGKLDLVVANQGSDNIKVFRNTSSVGAITASSFDTGTVFSVGAFPISVGLCDLNADGKLDVAVVCANSQSVWLLRNTATPGSFGSSSLTFNSSVSTTATPRGIAFGDIDKDGRVDMVVAHLNFNVVSVIRNSTSTSTISFATPSTYGTGTAPICVAVGDVDGDGWLDIAAGNYTSANVSVLRNTSSIGSVSMAGAVSFSNVQARDITFADIDGDGKQDMITANAGATSESIYVFRNTATSGSITSGSFASPVTGALQTYASPMRLCVADFDGDGKPDIAAGNSNFGLSIFRNISTSGTVAIAERVDYAQTGQIWDMAAGDVDGDGKADLAFPQVNIGNTLVVRNTAQYGIPTISALSAISANTGSSITISGTNFNPTAANNTVYFGAVRASVTSASATSLSVTVPVGATFNPVSITTAGTSLSGYSKYPFLPSFNNSSYVANSVNFGSGVEFVAGSGVWGGAIGDFDGDGKTDIVVSNYSSNTISVYRNTGSAGTLSAASFSSKVDFTTLAGPRFITVGDVDGDGKLDIVVAENNASSVSVFRNTATSGAITSASFAAPVDYATGSATSGVTLADVDGDGKPEIVTCNILGNNISVLQNLSSIGSVSFGSATNIATGNSPRYVVAGDIDGDGKVDIITGNDGTSNISVFRNTATLGTINSGSFAARVNFAIGTSPNRLCIGDIDGDGKPEVVVSVSGGNTVAVLRNTATSGSISASSLASPVYLATTGSGGIGLADMNGDGKANIVVESTTGFSVFRNVASSGSITSASFASRADFPVGSSGIELCLGDMDGDGITDVMQPVNASGTMRVTRNVPLGPVSGTATLCNGLTTTLSSNISGGSWSSGDTGVATVDAATGVVTGNAAGTATISYTLTGGTATAVVTVNAIPDTFSGQFNICLAGTGFTLANTISGGTWSSSNTFMATIGSSSGVVSSTGNSYGTCTISYTANGCVATRTLTVSTAGSAGVTGFAPVCAGSTLSFSAAIPGGTWSTEVPSVGTITSDGLFNALTPGVTRVIYTCGATAYQPQQTVTGTPVAGTITGMVSLTVGGYTKLYATGVGGSWSSASAGIASAGATGIISGVSAGTSVISYTVSNFCGSSTATKVVTVSEAVSYPCSAWQTSGTAAAGRADYSSITVDRNGTPYIAFADTLNGQKLSVMKFDGSAWVTVGSPAFTPGVALYPSLAADPSGNLYVAYQDNANSQKLGVKKFDGTSWVSVGATVISTGTIYFPSMAVDGNGNPYVGFVDYGNGQKATVLKYTGGSWNALGSAGFTPVTVGSTFLALDASGVPYLFYSNAAGGTYKGNVVKYNGTGWTAIGDADFTAGGVFNISMAVDASGKPYVSYQDGALGARATVMTYDGTAWVAPGGAGISPTYAFNTSIVCDAFGTPYVGYSDFSQGYKATVKKYNGSAWVNVGVAGFTPGQVFDFTMAIDGNGKLYVGFEDETNGRKPTVMQLNTKSTDFSGIAAICQNASTSLSAVTPGGTWTKSNSAITIGASSGVVTGVSAGTSVVTYTYAPGCSSFQVMTINALPAVNAGTTVAICPGGSATVTATGGTAYTWAPASGLSATSGATVISTPEVSITYTVTGTGVNGCVNTATKLVSVYPTPVLTSTLTASAICNNTVFHYTPTSSVGSTTFAWSRAAVSGISNSAGSGTNDPSETLVNTTAAPVTVTYVYTLTANGCTNTQSVTVSVKPTPVLSGALSSSICNNTVFNYEPASATSGTTFAWSRAAVTGITNSAASGTGNPAEELGNTTTAPVAVTYVYTLTANGCTNTQNVTVSVNPTPVLTSTLTAAPVCSSNTFNYTPASATTGTVFTWSRAAVAGISNGANSGTGNPSEALLNTTADPVVVTYVYTLTANGCSNAQSVSVTINPSAQLSTSLSGGAICSGNTFTYTPASATAGTTFAWSRAAVAGISTPASSGADSISETLTNSTLVNIPVTYVYSLTANSCTVTQNVTMTVNALPGVQTVTGGGNFCTGSTGVVTGLSGSQSGVNYQIFKSDSLAGMTAGTGSAILFPLQSAVGTYTVFATNATTGCVNDMSGSATIVTAAVPTPVVGPNALCGGTSGLLSSTTAGGTWSSNSSTIISVGSATGIITTGSVVGSAVITYAVTASCRAYYTVTNNPTPTAFTGSPAVCIGGTTALGTSLTGGIWSSTVPSVATVGSTGIVSGLTPGTTVISYVMPATGCYRSGTVNVVTTPGPIAGPASVCAGSSVELSNEVSGGSWTGSGVFATLSQNVAAGTVQVTGASAGTFNITYAIGSCRISRSMSVNPQPAFITGVMKACPGTTTSLANPTMGGTWSNDATGNATVDASGVVTGQSAGTGIISYTLSTGCARTSVVTVYATPVISGSTAVCTGGAITLSGGASGSWSSSATSVATAGSTGVITGVTPGTAAISYVSSVSGCSAGTVVTVNGAPATTGTMTVCAGSSTLLGNTAAGGTWSSGNTSVATVGTGGLVTGVAAGTVNIIYTVPGGCTRSAIVTVNALPSLTSVAAVCLGSTATLNATPAGGTWSGGTPGTATITASGALSGASAGTAPITYTGINGCSRMVVATVSVPVGSISSGSGVVCYGSTLSLSAGVSGGVWSSSAPSVASFTGSGSSTGVVSGLSLGTATISYVNGGCSASTVVSVQSSPSAITGAKSVCIGFTSALGSTPSGGTWSSSVPAIGTISAMGTVGGIAAGTTTIAYTGSNGCATTAVVTVNGLPVISGAPVFCEGSTTTLTNNNTNTVSWTSSNPSAATVNALGIVTGVGAGTSVIEYTQSSGCVSTITLTVNARPSAITGSLNVCMGAVTSLNSSAGGAWTSSNTTAAPVNASGVVSGIVAGQAGITYTLPNGCYRNVTVTVNPSPVITGANSVCLGGTTNLAAAGSGTWSSLSANATVPVTNGLVTGVSSGTAAIVFTWASNGCSSTRVVTVAACRGGGNTATGVSTATDVSLSFYPNPMHGSFTVTTPVAGTLAVMAVDGRVVLGQPLEAGATEVVLPQGTASGIYLCRFTDTDGNQTAVRMVLEQQ